MGTSERRQRERARREREIVARAKELFLDRGYDNTTIDEIADSLEISKGAIYLHFGSKEDLFFRVVREGLEIMLERFQEAVDREEDGLSKYGAIGIAYGRFWNDHPDYHGLLNMPVVRTASGDPGPERKLADEINDKIFRMSVSALSKGQEDGSVRKDLNPTLAAFIVSHSTRGVLEGIEENRQKLKERGVEPEAVMTAALTLYGQALGTDRSASTQYVGGWVKEKNEAPKARSRSSDQVRK